MQIFNFEQRTEEWINIRRGVPTASEFSNIVQSDGKPSKSRQKYLYRLVGQKLGAEPEEKYTNSAMQRGIELEASAREMYSRDVAPVVECGFCLADEGYGCSPDGLVGEDGLVEIKCPLLSTHVDYLIKQELPIEYFQQVQGQLLVTGRKYNDFISYYPGLKPLVVRVHRDEMFIELLKKELNFFIVEMNRLVEKLK